MPAECVFLSTMLPQKIGGLVQFMVASNAEDYFELVLDTFSALMYNTATLLQDAEVQVSDAGVHLIAFCGEGRIIFMLVSLFLLSLRIGLFFQFCCS